MSESHDTGRPVKATDPSDRTQAPSLETAQANRPIGVFDSGVGGLTVVSALQKRLPGESIVYLGDTARLPYGSKSAKTVTAYTRKNVEFLVDRGVKAVVIACNTASALALPTLRAEAGDGFGIPLWGVVEAGAQAAADQTSGSVGVIATDSTIRSNAYADELHKLKPEIRVQGQACPLFVPLVEEGWTDDPVARAVARRYLARFFDSHPGDGNGAVSSASSPNIDTLVLGCTHYPLLRGVVEEILGPTVSIVDSAASAANLVARDLQALGLAAPTGSAAEYHLHLTDTSPNFATLAQRILEVDGTTPELVELV